MDKALNARLLVALFLLPRVVAAESPVDFNRDIRPILSNACFRCHGPDPEERKAGLRLDVREGAIEDLGGYAAVVPGDALGSHLLERVTSADSDERMPPPDAGEALSEAEIGILRRWIEEGAPYARHWAYVPPARVTPPEVDRPDWVRQDVDRFILDRLREEGLEPSAEADPHVLARRVALDLTGLPPTREEVETFVRSASPEAYEDLVDGLLAKKAFGEHWARQWLDLARYADSTGYADDPPREIWAYRDYVIRSFNANKPFDEFTREQLAGDLLPEPTQEQLVATAFHRNTQTNNEGGTSDEEFRNVAVVDRVNTTFAVWMGTTMACAQCHTHKYDPITHTDYFSAFALFNNTADSDRRDEFPTLEVTTPAFERERAEKQRAVAELEALLSAPQEGTIEGFRRWQDDVRGREVRWLPLRPTALKSESGRDLQVNEEGLVTATAEGKDEYTITAPVSQEAGVTALRVEVFPEGQNVVLTEVALSPAETEVSDRAVKGRFVRVDLPGKGKMIHLAEVEVFSGGENVAPAGKATQSSTYAGAEAGRAIDGQTNGDYAEGSVSHTAADRDDPWWEVDLGKEVALDGLVIWNRTDHGLHSRLDGFRLSVFDEERNLLWKRDFGEASERMEVKEWGDGLKGVWRRAWASFSQEGFEVEKAIDGDEAEASGWALAPALDGVQTAIFELAEPLTTDAVTVRLSQRYVDHGLRRFRLSVTTAEPPVVPLSDELSAWLRLAPEARTEAQENGLFRAYAQQAPELEAVRKELAELREALSAMTPPTTVPIMRELEADQRRATHVQLRGNYLDLGQEVPPGLPESLFPAPEGALDRLALAEWLVDPANPLTARVTANRFWEAIFGIGLVATSEEFGSQGEPPSHPELLDWLAHRLMDSGWDVKGFLRLLVTSASYRQTSKVDPELLQRDPDNRLLARGPRFRLSAEMVRDQALFVSGLLSDKMYGEPVKPPQPNIGLSAAFGSGIDWQTSGGEDRYRRGLYTTWRRSNPYPSMATFDAPSREVCTVRRDRTNTPLQALVTLNDPVYMEAAQALARPLEALQASPEDAVEEAVWRVLRRPAKPEERRALARLYEDTREVLAADLGRAMALATEPLGPAPEGSDPTALAAWAVVCNVILNLDEVILKP